MLRRAAAMIILSGAVVSLAAVGVAPAGALARPGDDEKAPPAEEAPNPGDLPAAEGDPAPDDAAAATSDGGRPTPDRPAAEATAADAPPVVGPATGGPTGAALAGAPPAAANDRASLEVASTPAEADVFLDGRFVGRTPLALSDLAPGEHELAVWRQGHVFSVRNMDLPAGEASAVEVALEQDVAVPFDISLRYAPEISESREAGEKIVHSLLLAIVRYYVEDHDPRELLLRATEALVDVVAAVRDREDVLRRALDEQTRKRFYLEEIDLRGYPDLTMRRRAVKGGRLDLIVEADGELQMTVPIDPSNIDSYINGFRSVFQYVNDTWDADELISDDMLYFVALEGMLGVLGDEHSHFLPPSALEELQTETEGSFGGVGLVVSVRSRQLTAIAPIDGTPAHRAGILAGDEIVEIDGDATRELSLQQAVKRMRGDPGSKVKLTLRRKGQPSTFVLEIERATIKIRYLRSRLLDGDVGYVRVTSFIGETLQEDFADTIDALERQGMRGLVIDLRSNPGGLLDMAWKLADEFVADGTIVSTRMRGGEERDRLMATSDGTRPPYPIAVLVDRGSASASEILAGVLQDHERAVIVGERTFGKGSVQRVIPLDEFEVAFALTIATYHLPSGRTPHKVGITPDVEIPLDAEARRALAERSIYDEKWDWDPAEDPHLSRALELLDRWLRTGARPAAKPEPAAAAAPDESK